MLVALFTVAVLNLGVGGLAYQAGAFGTVAFHVACAGVALWAMSWVAAPRGGDKP
jgi:hypothetical protein